MINVSKLNYIFSIHSLISLTQNISDLKLMSGRCQNIADSSCLDILQYSSDHNNSNLASESLGIRLLEL